MRCDNDATSASFSNMSVSHFIFCVSTVLPAWSARRHGPRDRSVPLRFGVEQHHGETTRRSAPAVSPAVIGAALDKNVACPQRHKSLFRRGTCRFRREMQMT